MMTKRLAACKPLNSFMGVSGRGIYSPLSLDFGAGLMVKLNTYTELSVLLFKIRRLDGLERRNSFQTLGTLGTGRKVNRICLLNPLQRRSDSACSNCFPEVTSGKACKRSLKMLAESFWRGLNLRRFSLVKRR